MQLPSTIKECHELLQVQQKLITELKVMMVSMSLRIKDLENQLNQNSRDNQRPPSSDGHLKKPALGGNPKGSLGGKPGYGGNTLEMINNVDHTQESYPLLYAGHHLSHQGIRELFHNLYGHELNKVTIQATTQDLHVKLQTSELHLRQHVGQRPVIHFDETGQLLIQLYEASDKGLGKEKNIKTWVSKYYQICKIADEEEPPHQQGPGGRVKQTKGRNLLVRLNKYRRYVLAFAAFDDIPFTNNLAERDLRPAKTKQKVSGSFQTHAGAQRFARIRSFISTARKQSRYVFNELENAINGQSFVLQLAVVGT